MAQKIDNNGNLVTVEDEPIKQSDLMGALKEILSQMNKQQLDMFQSLLNQDSQARIKQKQIDVEKEIAKRTSARGEASAEFVKKMEKEIAEGRHYDILYTDADAKKHGKYFKHSVNGYDMHFFLNKVTRVPLILVNEVRTRLYGLEAARNARGKTALPGNFSVGQDGFTVYDSETHKPIGTISKEQVLQEMKKQKQKQKTL